MDNLEGGGEQTLNFAQLKEKEKLSFEPKLLIWLYFLGSNCSGHPEKKTPPHSTEEGKAGSLDNGFHFGVINP